MLQDIHGLTYASCCFIEVLAQKLSITSNCVQLVEDFTHYFQRCLGVPSSDPEVFFRHYPTGSRAQNKRSKGTIKELIESFMKINKVSETSVRIIHDNDCNTVEKEVLIQRFSRSFKKALKKALAEEMMRVSLCKAPCVMIWIVKRKKQLSMKNMG